MPGASFGGLRVLSLESRHAKEMARLIAMYGGEGTVAPALREIALESNQQALAFAAALIDRQFDMVIFLTGAGIRALVGAVESTYPSGRLSAALQQVQVVARGSKPLSALGELGVKPAFVVPEPNTWREVLFVLDESSRTRAISGLRVAVQEYGVACTELLAGLKERGARVTRVPLYRWSLPEDIIPLRAAASSLASGEFDVVLLTAGIQARHLFQVAAEMGIEESVCSNLERMVLASIGPTTSEFLSSVGLQSDLEASHPKMGFLVKEAAERSVDILREKHKEPALDFLHEIGSRMAGGSPLREVLERIVDFSAAVVKCDSCFVYVLEEGELILRASKNPHPEELDCLKLQLGEGITGWVAKNRQPVAVARNAFHDPRFQFFNELPEDRYEAFLSVPILCRDKLVGVINLQHREPHSYTRREIRLISTIGFLVGAEIEGVRLEEKSTQLFEELETRKIVERAKGILQRELELSEQEAYFSIRKQSRQLRQSMKEIAAGIVNDELERTRKRSRA
jgi:uroporphyrinogen-III synthase